MSTLRRRRGVLAGTAVVLALLGAAVVAFAMRGGSEAASVRIEPADALLDAPLRMEVDGADDGAPIRLTLSATSTDGVLWSGSRTVRADNEGRISVDAGTLLASLQPTGVPESPKLGLFPRDDALTVRVEARAGDRVLGEATAVRRMFATGVSSVELTAQRDSLVAHYWTGAPGTRRPTAVIALGGSEGGYGNGLQARLLASHGYPVLELAYFGAPGRPKELRSIPLEYLERRRARAAHRLDLPGARPGGRCVRARICGRPRLVDAPRRARAVDGESGPADPGRAHPRSRPPRRRRRGPAVELGVRRLRGQRAP